MTDGTRIFAYTGRMVGTSSKTQPQANLSPANALEIIKAAFLAGRMQISDHFRRQSAQRNFDLLDAENVIRTGGLRGSPEFCPINLNWKYRIIADIEDEQLEVVVALDPSEDYDNSPLIILITGYWR